MKPVTKEDQKRNRSGRKLATRYHAGETPSELPSASVPQPKIQVAKEEENITVVSPAEVKDRKRPHGIRDWHGSIGGVSENRMRDCICFHLDVYKDPWWFGKINSGGRGFLRNDKIARLINDATPEEYEWSDNPLVNWKAKHVDGSDDKILEKTIARLPKNKEERARLREMFGVTEYSVRYLAKQSCPKCKGTGYYLVFPYPEAPRLSMSVQCLCVNS